MKKKLYNFFIISPIGIILVAVFIASSLWFIYRDFTINKYLEYVAQIVVIQEEDNRIAKGRLIDSENEIEHTINANVHVYWDFDLLSFRGNIINIETDPITGEQIVVILIDESEIYIPADTYGDFTEATIRMVVDEVSIWRRLFQ